MKPLVAIVGALALVAVAAWAQTRPAYPLALPRGCRDRSCVRERALQAVAPLANFVLDREYDFGDIAGNPPTLPTFASEADAGRTLVLKGVVSWDGGYVWFTDDNNTVAGTPAQNGTTFVSTTPWGWGEATNIADSTAPITTGYASGQLWKGDNSEMCWGYPVSKFSSTMTALTTQAGVGATGGGIRIRFNSGAMTCGWYQTTQFPQVSLATDIIDKGLGVFGCTRSGGSHFAWTGASLSAAVDAGDTTTVSGTTTLWTGRDDNSSAGAANGGPIGPCLIWSQFFDAGAFQAVARQMQGAPTTSDVSFQGTPFSCYPVDGGNAWCMGGRNFVGLNGYRSMKGETAQNKWAADPLDVSSWTLSGAATVTTNVNAGGPFYEWKHTNTADLLQSLDGGIASATSGNGFLRVSQGYNVNCYASSGDAGAQQNQLRIELDTNGTWQADGGTAVYCDYTLTGTPTSLWCPAALGVSGNSVTAKVMVNDAGQTGSAIIYYCGLNASYWPEVLEPNNSSVTNASLQIDAGSWHTHVNGGKYEACFIADVSSTTTPGWVNNTDNVYLSDAVIGGGGHVTTDIGGYTVSGRFLYITAAADGGETDTTIDGMTWTHGQIYCASLEWTPAGNGFCNTAARWDPWPGTGSLSSFHASTTWASTSNAICPDDPAMMFVAERYDNSVPVAIEVLSERIFYVP